MDVVVGPRGYLTDYHFARHIRPSRPGVVRIDLSATAFVDPFGLAAVAAIVENAAAGEQEVRFVDPADDDCRRYLHRMGLADVLDSYGVPHALTPVRRHATGDRLLVLQRFNVVDTAADSLAEQVFRIFDAAGDARAGTLYDAVQEIAQNVVDHSDAGGGFIALQQFPRTNEVSFAVSDPGIGLRAALQKRHTVDSDGQSIALAVARHVSSSGEDRRGIGLSSVVNHTRRSGRVQLWSGDSSGTFTKGRASPRLTRHSSSFPGTVAQARLGVR